MNAIERQLAQVLPEIIIPEQVSVTTNLPSRGTSTIPEGQRNAILAHLAGSMRRKGFSSEAIAAALKVTNREACQPALEDCEVEVIARSIGRYAPAAEAGSGLPDVIAERFSTFCDRLRTRVAPRDVVPGLVPGFGITMLHGQPRALKTWTAQEIARACSTGSPAFGLERFSVDDAGPTWYCTEEDPELETRDRFGCLFAGRGEAPSDLLHVTIQKSLNLDDPTWQNRMIEYALREAIKLSIIDPIRAASAAVDQGPREVRPLALFLREFMRATGSAVLLVHHDTKPIAGKADDRARPQRASGGGIFSIADAPIHAELISATGSQTLLAPTAYKFSTAPEPFIVTLEADRPKNPTWVRIQGADTAAAAATELLLHERIREHLRDHPGASGSQVAHSLHARKDQVLAALDQLERRGILTYQRRGQARLWSVLSEGQV